MVEDGGDGREFSSSGSSDGIVKAGFESRLLLRCLESADDWRVALVPKGITSSRDRPQSLSANSLLPYTLCILPRGPRNY